MVGSLPRRPADRFPPKPRRGAYWLTVDRSGSPVARTPRCRHHCRFTATSSPRRCLVSPRLVSITDLKVSFTPSASHCIVPVHAITISIRCVCSISTHTHANTQAHTRKHKQLYLDGRRARGSDVSQMAQFSISSTSPLALDGLSAAPASREVHPPPPQPPQPPPPPAARAAHRRRRLPRLSGRYRGAWRYR